jgi:hypothetical protein
MSRQGAMTPGNQNTGIEQLSGELADQYSFGFAFALLGALASWRLI